jgi:hypothetical protein
MLFLTLTAVFLFIGLVLFILYNQILNKKFLMNFLHVSLELSIILIQKNNILEIVNIFIRNVILLHVI